MNLVFLYSSRGRIPIDKPNRTPIPVLPDYDYTVNKPTNAFLKSTLSDLYPYIWDKLLETKVFDKITTIFEVGSGFGTTLIKNNPNNRVCFIPHISEVFKFIEPDDLIFVRGAWIWWKNVISKLAKEHYLIYYRGGRKIFRHWKWSLVLDDIRSHNYMDKWKHTNIFYPKCINEDIFNYNPSAKKNYDIILPGEVKHSKGQWRVLEAVGRYKKIYGHQPSICVVGKIKEYVDFNKIKKKYKLNIHYKGVVDRNRLCKYYNMSKIYVHLGKNEQGPRTTLEAIRCGLPILISDIPSMWPDWERESFFCEKVNYRDYDYIANTIHKMLNNTEYNFKEISDTYSKYVGLDKTCNMWQNIVEKVKSSNILNSKIFEQLVH